MSNMQYKDKYYLFFILIHVVLGVGIFALPAFSNIYGLLILFIGIYFIVKNRNRNNEALYAAAYIVGAEVFLRMTHAVFLYEYGKYGVMIFMILGMFYSGLSKGTIPYWLYLLLLIPGVVIATQTLNLDTDIRKRIIFNISGPVCLGIASIYAYNRKITIQELNGILLFMGLPIISMAVYLTLYVPDLKSVLIHTSSNSKTSGGFGPNQVSTVLGLGMFIFFSRAVTASKTYLTLIINTTLVGVMGYRGLVTFSRGGLVTGFVMIVALLFFSYFNLKAKGKMKMGMVISTSVIFFLGLWSYTELQTGGFIGKRYSNQDAEGRTKSSLLSGREKVAETEFDAFFDNPFFGIGVAKAKEYREEEIGEVVASHSEVTRLLAEHGSLGIMALLILIATPAMLYLNNKQHIYLFCFVAFWLMTINHAAMRIGAPAFVYALSLLKVTFNDPKKPALHRE